VPTVKPVRSTEKRPDAGAQVKPLSQKYIACQGTSVTIGFSPTDGMSYYWYAGQADESTISGGNSVNQIMAVKDASSVQIWWVEPRYNGEILTRCRVDLELGDCDVVSPTGCAVTGTILYREDFGGNDPNDPEVSLTGLLTNTIDP
jgi:hypothetical protein